MTNKNITITSKKQAMYCYFLAAILSGLLLIPANPPINQGYFAWFALLPMLWASMQVSPKKAFLVGFISGLPIHFYLNLYIGQVLFNYLSFPLALITFIALVVYISCFNGLFSLAFKHASMANFKWLAALSAPSLWLIMEYARSQTFLAYNVGYLGYTQWSYPSMLQFASIYGYWGLPFIMVLFQTSILFFFIVRFKKPVFLINPILLAVLLLGGLLSSNLLPTDNSDQKIQVALIQGNTNPEYIATTGGSNVLKHHLELTEEALYNNPSTQIAVWPETIVSLNFDDDKSHIPDLKNVAENLDIAILYGARIRENNNLFNAITMYQPGQKSVPVYYKHHLVPFVEYFPLEHILNRLLNLELLLGRYKPGDQIKIFEIEQHKIAGVICFESYFGNHTRQFANSGAKHLFVLTNDAWFDKSIGLDLHAQVAAIRAAEMGIGVTQVANSGITISFDHRGRELFRLNTMESTFINYSLDLKSRDTIYTMFGDYFPIFWTIFLLISATYEIIKVKFKATLKTPL